MEGEKKTYGVWVGSLTDIFTEEDLFQAFKCCGPICNVKITLDKNGKSRGFAFVNFYNKEAAEVAANDMDGAFVLGTKIKASFKDSDHKKKDFRPFTDCLSFMQGQQCIPGSKVCQNHI